MEENYEQPKKAFKKIRFTFKPFKGLPEEEQRQAFERGREWAKEKANKYGHNPNNKTETPQDRVELSGAGDIDVSELF